jgi:hypothetical protein
MNKGGAGVSKGRSGMDREREGGKGGRWKAEMNWQPHFSDQNYSLACNIQPRNHYMHLLNYVYLISLAIDNDRAH